MGVVKGYALFATTLGRCGVHWSDAGLAGLLLPDFDDATLRRRLEHRSGAEEAVPPGHVADAIARVVALTSGELADLSRIELDLRGVPAFHQRVYRETRQIPPGTTSTYGALARQLGDPGASRAVGQALGRNPFAIVVPCHRVLAASGIGGFTAPGGLHTKAQLLAIESRHTQPGLWA